MSLLHARFAPVVLAASIAAGAQSSEPFPAPFAVEHHVVDGSLGGEPIAGETVRDTYGGSFLVSERTNGIRTIVDFARREVTEVRPGEGTYWSLSFGRFAELRSRLEEAEATDESPKLRARAAVERPAIRVEEMITDADVAAKSVPSAPREGGKHLRVSVEGGRSLEVWVDASAPRLTASGVAALTDFERSVLGAGDGEIGPADLLEAVRRREAGALAVRTRRTVGRDQANGADGPFLETVVTKATPVAALPAGLVSVPEGLRRVPSPLEVVVSWAEDEAALRRRGRK